MIISKFSKLISAICAIPIFALLVNQTYGAARTVTVNSANNQLLYPNADTFKNSNGIGGQFSKYICIRVNTLWMFATSLTQGVVGIYACEAEVKVLNSNGELIYHASTRSADADYHNNVDVHDPNCKIYYYVSIPGTNNACVSAKRKLNNTWGTTYSIESTLSDSYGFNYASTVTIGGVEIPYSSPFSVTGIDFYPNLNGKTTNKQGTTESNNNIRDIFTNPNNTIWVSIKTSDQLQRDINGKRVWVPATVIHQDTTTDLTLN